jgi:hypothetical protein
VDEIGHGEIFDLRFSICDCRFGIADLGLPIADCRLPIYALSSPMLFPVRVQGQPKGGRISQKSQIANLKSKI